MATITPSRNDILTKCLLDKCRVCLKPGEILIFGANDISSVVQEFGGVLVSEDDKRPQLLCDICHSLLEGAIIFRHTAQKSEQILLKANDYLIGQNDVAFPSPISDEQTSKLDGIIANIKMLSDNISEPIESSNKSDTVEQDSNESKTSFGSDSEESDTVCEYLEYNIFSTDDEFNEGSTDGKDIKYLLENEKSCEGITKNSTVTCDVCQKDVGKDFYKNHMKLHRNIYMQKASKNSLRKKECKVCHKVISHTYYNIHMKQHESNSNQAERFRKCHLCDKILTARYYSTHMIRVHMGRKNKDDNYKNSTKLKCPVCDKNVYEDLYKEHLAGHGKPPKKYVCEKCGMTTIYPSAFKTHCLTHSNEFKYKCPHCPYKGLHLALLRVHERTHTGEYNYICHICSARFITKSNLTQHQRVHGFSVDYTCDECNHGFNSRRALDRHYKTVHLKDKSHICDICGKGFGHRDNMLSHQLQVHDRKRMVTKGRLPSYLRTEDSTAN